MEGNKGDHVHCRSLSWLAGPSLTDATMLSTDLLCVKGYLHPVNNTRFVATYSEEQHNKFVWDITGYSYTARYMEEELAGHSGPGDLYGFDPQEAVPEGVQVSIWQQVEAVLHYMTQAHGLRLQGI